MVFLIFGCIFVIRFRFFKGFVVSYNYLVKWNGILSSVGGLVVGDKRVGVFRGVF